MPTLETKRSEVTSGEAGIRSVGRGETGGSLTTEDVTNRQRSEANLAVRQGFEPWVEALRPYNGLANRRLQPLGHLTDPCKYTANNELWIRDCPCGCPRNLAIVPAARENRGIVVNEPAP